MPVNIIYLLLAGLLCLYYAALKIRIARISGFRFYIRTGLGVGAIFFLLFLSALLPESLDRRPLVIGLVVALTLAQIYEILQEERQRKTCPAAWQAWKAFEKQAGFWSRLRLYPGAPTLAPIQDKET